MTVIFECDGRFQWKPWIYRSSSMTRFGWGWFALAFSRHPLDELMKLLFIAT